MTSWDVYGSGRQQPLFDEAAVFPTVFIETTIMKYDPPNFVKYHKDFYLKTLIQYFYPLLTEIEIIGVHGEDGGSGVVTRITWLSGGVEAAEEFRKICPVWDEIEGIFNSEDFGEGCHLEGFSYTCVVRLFVSNRCQDKESACTLIASLL